MILKFSPEKSLCHSDKGARRSSFIITLRGLKRPLSYHIIYVSYSHNFDGRNAIAFASSDPWRLLNNAWRRLPPPCLDVEDHHGRTSGACFRGATFCNYDRQTERYIVARAMQKTIFTGFSFPPFGERRKSHVWVFAYFYLNGLTRVSPPATRFSILV